MPNYRVVYRLGECCPNQDFECFAWNASDASDTCRETIAGAKVEAVYVTMEKAKPKLTDEQLQLLYIEFALDRLVAEKDNDDAKEDACLDQMDILWKQMTALGESRTNHIVRTVMYLLGDIDEACYLKFLPKSDSTST
jgi:hypothetical protein